MVKQKWIFLVFMIAMFVACVVGCAKREKTVGKQPTDEVLEGTSPGNLAPLFSAQTVDGKKINLRDYRGRKVVLLNFWATWCPSCRREMPILDRIYGKYKKQGLVILGINVSESRGRVKAFLKNKKITYPVLLDENGEVTGPSLYHLYGVPDNIIIDKKGIVIYHKPYPPKDAEKFFSEILKE